MTKQDKGFRKRHWKHEAHRRLSHRKHVLSVKIANCTVKLRFMDMRFVRTPHYYGQFALPLGKESPYIFSKFNPLNRDTPLIIYKDTFYSPSVSVLTGLTVICLPMKHLGVLKNSLKRVRAFQIELEFGNVTF